MLILQHSTTSVHHSFNHFSKIEGCFKVAKQYLQFDKTQIQSYDGLCGHLAIVARAYDILALNQQENIDERTLRDIFFDYD